MGFNSGLKGLIRSLLVYVRCTVRNRRYLVNKAVISFNVQSIRLNRPTLGFPITYCEGFAGASTERKFRIFNKQSSCLDVRGSVHHSTVHKENPTRCNMYRNVIIPYLYEVQRVLGEKSTNYTSNNLPRMKNQRLPVHF